MFVERLPYPVDAAVERLAGLKHVVLVGARDPVGFFGYPGKPSRLAPPDCAMHVLAEPAQDQADALARLAERLGAADRTPIRAVPRRPSLPRGPLDQAAIADVLGALLPENAIVVDESVTTGRGFFAATAGAPAHDWLQLTGGAIGLGIPMAVGAAVACPERKVVALQADGSGMYTLQGLLDPAVRREDLDVLTCILVPNRFLEILRGGAPPMSAPTIPGRRRWACSASPAPISTGR